MDCIGLRELRQDASELLRRVEHGEELIVMVDGRTAARLVPVGQDRWRRWVDVQDVFSSAADEAWADDLDRFDASPASAWDRTH